MKKRGKQDKGKRGQKSSGGPTPATTGGQSAPPKQPFYNKKPLKIPIDLPEDHLTCAMRGPTSYSNWVVRGRLLVGAYPLKPHMTESLLQVGVTAFVCLMEEHEFGQHLTSGHYMEVARDILVTRPSEFAQKPQALRYVHHPIPDRKVVSDDATLAMVEQVLNLLRTGEIVYIHCYGGHGRTGILASVLLGRIYEIDAEKALRLCQLYHDSRPDVEGISASSVPSPQTHDQRTQVMRLLRS